MKKYQAKKHFEWGNARFEPLQYLVAEESGHGLTITKESSGESFIVSEQALQYQLELGNILEK